MVVDSNSADAADGKKRRKIRLMLLLLILVVSALLVRGLFVCVWDGRFDLTLDVISLSGERIADVSYAAFSKRDGAHWAETDANEAAQRCFRPTIQDGGWYVASIACSGKTWIFGIETSYTELRYIVVRVKYRNGKVVRRMAEIPAGRGPRSMAISVP